jgi:hypothetical protein
MNPQTEKPLFVETTIHIWHHTRSNAVKRRIEATLQARETVSSTYVKAEYLNTYLRAAVEAHRILLQAEDMEDALGYWENYLGSQYKLGVRFLILSVFRDDSEKRNALHRLQILIEHIIPDRLAKATKTLTDATQCAAANIRPHWNGTNYELVLDFPPSEAPPGLHNFLTRNQALLAKIENSITSEDKHWRGVKASIRQILNGQFALGKRSWERLADVIIALEVYECQSEIYTGNVRHFGPLCEAIQLPMKPEAPR